MHGRRRTTREEQVAVVVPLLALGTFPDHSTAPAQAVRA
jgi:hypothetical protein